MIYRLNRLVYKEDQSNMLLLLSLHTSVPKSTICYEETEMGLLNVKTTHVLLWVVNRLNRSKTNSILKFIPSPSHKQQDQNLIFISVYILMGAREEEVIRYT
jgi:hypothetical protein